MNYDFTMHTPPQCCFNPCTKTQDEAKGWGKKGGALCSTNFLLSGSNDYKTAAVPFAAWLHEQSPATVGKSTGHWSLHETNIPRLNTLLVLPLPSSPHPTLLYSLYHFPPTFPLTFPTHPKSEEQPELQMLVYFPIWPGAITLGHHACAKVRLFE